MPFVVQDAAELDEPRALGLLIDLGSLDDVDPTMLSTLLEIAKDGLLTWLGTRHDHGHGHGHDHDHDHDHA